MSQLLVEMTQDEVTAAIKTWVETPANFNPPVQHQMNPTIPPAQQANGQMVVTLNF